MRSASARGLASEINVTPLVDVMLVLLIIFMVAAPLLDRGIDVELPAAESGEQGNSAGVVITLTREHVIHLDGKVVTMAELRRRLSGFADRPVLIQADRNAYVSRLVDLWDACRMEGLRQVRIVTVND